MNGKDREQFREFMVSRWPELVRLAYSMPGDRWLAEDLAQTALARACPAWWRVSRAEDPDAYVRRSGAERLMAIALPVTRDLVTGRRNRPRRHCP